MASDDFFVEEGDYHEDVAGEKFTAGDDGHGEPTDEDDASDKAAEAVSVGATEQVHASHCARGGGEGDEDAGEKAENEEFSDWGGGFGDAGGNNYIEIFLWSIHNLSW